MIRAMKKDEKFRFAEKCLYEYKRNMACLEVLKEDLYVTQADTDVKGQNYQYTLDFTGGVSDPVSARLIKIENLEYRIKHLERLTRPITSLIDDLNSEDVLNGSHKKELMHVLRLLYFGCNTPEAIMGALNIAKSTYFKRRHEIVCITICYMGL